MPLRCARRRPHTHGREKGRADPIELLHRRRARCCDVQIGPFKIAYRRLIDGVDRITRIQKTVEDLCRVIILRQSTPHQGRAKKTPDESVIGRLPRCIEIRHTQDGDGKPLFTIGIRQCLKTHKQLSLLRLRRRRIRLHRGSSGRKYLRPREQEHAPYLRLLRQAQQHIQTLHRMGGIPLQPIDEKVQILHGKDRVRLLTLRSTVIRLNSLRRLFFRRAAQTADLPCLLAEAGGEKLLEVARQPHKHHFFCPSTHTIVLYISFALQTQQRSLCPHFHCT